MITLFTRAKLKQNIDYNNLSHILPRNPYTFINFSMHIGYAIPPKPTMTWAALITWKAKISLKNQEYKYLVERRPSALHLRTEARLFTK